jgi:NADH dehydrogenase [ubiquinone] 1 alpha subcomplex assembly factor 7
LESTAPCHLTHRKTIRNFPDLTKAIEAVYLVEASPKLREAQHKLLCGDKPLTENDLGHESTSRHSDDIKIVWAEDLRLVPKETNKSPFIIAHEFFDALPIHVFQASMPPAEEVKDTQTIQTPTGPIQRPQTQQRSQHQWQELLVSPKPPHRLKEGEPEFELSISRTATPHSMYLPETSPRYQALKSTDGATIEVSPESQSHVRDLAIRLGGSNPIESSPKPTPIVQGRKVNSSSREEPLIKPEPSGAALVIDYGPASTIPANSLRGIRSHQRVSPFDSPGVVDISADVDFLALAECAVISSPGVEVHGPLDQARFLTAMGIEERASQLVKRAVDKERGGSTGQDKGELTELVKRVESGWKRLVDRGPQGMGRLYQVMAIVPHVPPKEGEPRRRPVGFGGDVQF